MKKYIFIALIAVVCLATTSVVLAKDYITGYDVNNGCKQVEVERGAYVPGISLYLSECQSLNIGVTTKSNLVTSGNLTVGGNVSVTGTIIGDEKMVAVAKTSITSTTTLVAADSGKTYYISASGTDIVLPAVTASGAHFKFIIGGAVDTANVAIMSAEGDNIEGSVIVAGAVVGCDAADVLTFVADGENIGDFVEVISTGTYWVPLQSGALTASKLTCSG